MKLFVNVFVLLLMSTQPLLAAKKPAAKVDLLKGSTTKTYKTIGEDVNLQLHIFNPADHKVTDKSPAIVFFFGGGWSSGTPAQFARQSQYLASRGMVAICAEYRTKRSHKTTPFECVKDAKSCVRWVRKNAKDLGIDGTRIAAGGGSTGGHLAAATATLTGFNEDKDKSISCIPNALVLFNPVFDNGPDGYGYEKVKEQYKQFSPIDNIKKGLPPTLVMLGTKDHLIPVKTAERFKALAEKVNSRCDLKLYEGQKHGFFNYNKNPEMHLKTTADMDEFLTSIGYLKEKPANNKSQKKAEAVGEENTRQKLDLWYEQPAKKWIEALPIGNGSFGAMVFGTVAKERIQFNDDTLFTGQPHDYAHKGAVKYLPEIRKLLLEGKQKEAEALAEKEFMSISTHGNNRQEAYQPFGDINLIFPGHETFTDYYRSLDLNEATATVRYKVDGVTYTRQVFASYPDQAIIMQVRADKPGKLNFTAGLTCPHKDSSVKTQANNLLVMSGQVENGKTRFEGRLLVRPEGGKVTATDEGITIAKANSATLILVGASSYVNYRDISANPSELCTKKLKAIGKKSFTKLRKRHIADYQKLFNRCRLDLGVTDKAKLPTDKRLKQFGPEDPQLVTLFFQYGRYLLISCSRPGSQPANLQGLWNDKVRPPWESKYTCNINTEMNYWPAELTNLPECQVPLFSALKDLSVTGANVAKEHYGARGWVVHHNFDLWRGAAPINRSNHGIWVTGGAWMCQNLWWHYEFGRDKKYLKETAYPLMKNAALFFVDFLVEYPGNDKGWLISGPSNSPENGGLVMGPTMDHQIIRNLFANVIEASRVLDVDKDFRNKLIDMRRRIAPNQIGKHGQLQEWLEDKDDPKNRHRHVSHLWGLHPGNEIHPLLTPDLAEACKVTLGHRGDGGTGWSKAWKINFWARLLDGDHSFRMLAGALRGNTYPNLFDAHPPFQIDGNFGATSGITEMLLQSHVGQIHLLPALPSALANGSVKGLRARGGFEVDMSWKDGELVSATIHSRPGTDCIVRYKGKTLVLNIKKGKKVKLTGKDLLLPGAVSVPATAKQAQSKLTIPTVDKKDTICFAPYTVGNNIMKMTAQLYPLAPEDSRTVRLEIKKGWSWKQIATAAVDESDYGIGDGTQRWTASFRVENWDSTKDWQYRLAHGKSCYYTGRIRKDPVDKETIVVAAFTGNSNRDRGQKPDIIANIKAHDPDLLFFSGDQSYDHKKHLAAWLLFGRQFGEIIRDRPTVCIPDDHDIGQGNLWGAGGKVSKTPAGPDGGYFHPVQYVKSVENAQTSNLPDPYDPTPILRGIGVYYTSLNIGGVDFAIIEDRKFKSGPDGLVPKMGPRPDHINDPDYDPKTVDVAGAKLLGQRQLKFLSEWGKDWRAVEMKAVLSQTVFANAAHIHKGNRLIADMDSNGWPQSGRNRALDEIRKSFSLMIGGDQHLATVIHHGIDEFGGAGFSFCVPSIVNFYPRQWMPLVKGVNPVSDKLDHTGSYLDGFGNHLTMYAYANPYEGKLNYPKWREKGQWGKLAAGHGIIRFNKKTRKITMECWPRGVDVTKKDAKQFPGWPVTVNQLDNFGKKAVAYLPTIKVSGMTMPVIQVIDESSKQVIYTLRIKGDLFRPKVFAEGSYTVIVGDQQSKVKKLKGLKSLAAKDTKIIQVTF